jgi:hypothetical protein
LTVAEEDDPDALARTQPSDLGEIFAVGADRCPLDGSQDVTTQEVLVALDHDREIAAADAGAVGGLPSRTTLTR